VREKSIVVVTLILSSFVIIVEKMYCSHELIERNRNSAIKNLFSETRRSVA
jgi:hypothetical protein